jgi:hypothetical protein
MVRTSTNVLDPRRRPRGSRGQSHPLSQQARQPGGLLPARAERDSLASQSLHGSWRCSGIGQREK